MRSPVPSLLALLTPFVVSTAVASAQQENPANTEVVAQEDLPKPVGPGDIDWIAGPATGDLGSVAEIRVPQGYIFADGKGARRFLELTQNIPGGTEVGVLLPWDETQPENAGWFVIFDYADVGHVKDEEKDELDADALLETLQEGTRLGNEERKKRGWATMELVGWQKPPFYDEATNNLTWATLGRSEGGESVNWSTRMLGREGYMTVDLVMGKDEVDAVVPRFTEVLRGFEYKSGQRYAEFREGDKVAEYGLAALVAGGMGVAAFKFGLLQKLWKPIAIGLAVLATQFKRIWGWITGSSRKPDEPTDAR